MNSMRLTWAIGVCVVAIFLLRTAGPQPSRQDLAAGRTLADIRSVVRARYVEEVNPAELDQAAINGLTSRLDRHTIFIPPSHSQDFVRYLDGNFVGIGVRLSVSADGKILITSPIDGGPAFEAGVEAGDRITHVEGIDVTGKSLDDVANLVRGPVGSRVNITFEKADGSSKTLAIERREVHVPQVVGVSRTSGADWNWWLDENLRIGYVGLRQFSNDIHTEFISRVRELRNQNLAALVIDLRTNGGGRLDAAVAIADLFIDSGVIVSTRGRASPEITHLATAADTITDLPLVVLVDGSSASASEILAGALQDHRRATIVGSQTYGKGSVQETIPLDGGILNLTVAYYYLPSGRLVHRKPDATDWGVRPDVEIPDADATGIRLSRVWAEREAIRIGIGKSMSEILADDPQLDAARKTALALLIARPSE